MSKKSREKKKSDSQPKNLLCNKSDEELIELITSVQEDVNSGVIKQTDILLIDVLEGALEERGYVIMKTLKIEHASKVASDEHWGNNQSKGKDEGDKKTDSSNSEPRSSTDYKHLEDPDWPQN